MRTIITHDIKRMQPGRQCSRFHLPLPCNGASTRFIRIIIKIGNKPHFGQCDRHPERRIIMRIAVFGKKMVKKFNSPLHYLPFLVTFDMYAFPFLQIISPMREIRSRGIGKRALTFGVKVSQEASKSNLYAFNRIQNKKTQISIESIQQPYFIQGCPWNQVRQHIPGSISYTKRMPVCTQTIIPTFFRRCISNSRSATRPLESKSSACCSYERWGFEYCIT